jgi:hypothetical protein
MGRTFRRLAILGSFGLGLAAFAPAAQAAGPVTTLPANQVTTNQATIWGHIDTGGQTTSYRFQYGTSSAYQFATAWQTIAGSVPQTFVEASILRLRPNTTYHFRVAAVFFGIGGHYQEEKDGDDLTFTTKPIGRLALLSHRVHVARGVANVRLGCRSHAPCKGGFSIRTAAPAGKSGVAASVLCASGRLRIRPGKAHTFTSKLRPACRSRLNRSPSHALRALFVASTRTGQRGVNRAIKLIG